MEFVDFIAKKRILEDAELLKDMDKTQLPGAGDTLASKRTCEEIYQGIKKDEDNEVGYLPSGAECLYVNSYYDPTYVMDGRALSCDVLRQTTPMYPPYYVLQENGFITAITAGGLKLCRPLGINMTLSKALLAAEQLTEALNEELARRKMPLTPFAKQLTAEGSEVPGDKVVLVALEGDSPNGKAPVRFCFCLDFDYKDADKPVLMFREDGLAWFNQRLGEIEESFATAEKAWKDANGDDPMKLGKLYSEYKLKRTVIDTSDKFLNKLSV